MDKYDVLKLENQICFPLYVCSKEIVKMYKPFLDELDLTYTQYITMMIMWEHKELCIKEIGNYLYLDSGTLTPVLKKLEGKKFITRNRSKNDERDVVITITSEGESLRERALAIPSHMMSCIKFDEDAKTLFELLNKLLIKLTDKEKK